MFALFSQSGEYEASSFVYFSSFCRIDNKNMLWFWRQHAHCKNQLHIFCFTTDSSIVEFNALHSTDFSYSIFLACTKFIYAFALKSEWKNEHIFRMICLICNVGCRDVYDRRSIDAKIYSELFKWIFYGHAKWFLTAM